MHDMNFSSRIESFFSKRFGSRPALYVPSGRFGLWLAARHTLPPSARVLLSPVTCDQVVYALLAAGMTPVFGPVNPSTGNLDPRAIPADHWRGLDAVLTTNLYGAPDDMAYLLDASEAHGIVLIEDACHAFDSSVRGRRIGSFGVCAVFSLAKHLGGAGGVVLFRDESDRPALEKMIRGGLGSPLLERMRSLARRVWSRLFGPPTSTNPVVGHRTLFDRRSIDEAVRRAPSIKAFDPFLGSGSGSYRCAPALKNQAATLKALENWEAEAGRRRESVRQFGESGMIPEDIALPDDSTVLRVPLFVKNREETIASLASDGIRVSLVYDPPLHEQFPWLQSIGGPWSPAHSRWCDEVLPIAPEQLAMFTQVRGRPG